MLPSLCNSTFTLCITGNVISDNDKSSYVHLWVHKYSTTVGTQLTYTFGVEKQDRQR